MARLNGLEAWRRIVVPVKPRSEAKRNALHSLVHNPSKSRSLAVMIDDLDEWEKTVEQFELCQSVLTEADRRTILLRKLPTSISSSLLSNLRKILTYVDMKAEIESEIVFIRDYGSGGAAGHAHVADEQAPPNEEEQASTAEDDEKGILELDLSGMSPE